MRGVSFNVFISYSHAADGRLAPALQSALQRFARKWYGARAMRVFRDETNLAASPGLWSSIEEALNSSEFFILLASPKAAGSTWIKRELEAWRQKRNAADKLLLVVTDGGIAWDASAPDFDWRLSTAVSPSLMGLFATNPVDRLALGT